MKLFVKKAIWFLFYKRKGVKFNLPGPTSTSHPFGWISPLPEGEEDYE